MAFIKTIPYEVAPENIKGGYDSILRHTLKVGNIHAVSAIRPAIMETLFVHFRTVMYGPAGLSRAEKEMIATVVSVVNRCQY